jgi:hypothetical protein
MIGLCSGQAPRSMPTQYVHCRRNPAGYKRHVLFVGELPRTTVNKTFKATLRDRFNAAAADPSC